MKEERVVIVDNREKLVSGYFLSVEELQKLLKDYHNNIDFMGDTKVFIENWLTHNVK